MGRKGLGTFGLVAVALLSIALVGGGIGGAYLYTQGSSTGVSPNADQDPSPDNQVTGDWADKQIKLNIQGKNLSSEDLASGTLHFYSEKPQTSDTNYWKDQALISETFGSDMEDFTYSIEADGITTIQETPGKYYVVAEVDGDYYSFFTVTVPDGSNTDAEAFEYNQAPNLVKFTSKDRHALGSQAYDLGISSNTSVTKDHTAQNTYTPSEETVYMADRIIVQPGDVDFTTDSNSDGTYDEGVSKLAVEVSGAVGQNNAKRDVFFHPSNGVDELGADDKAVLEFVNGLEFNDDNSMTVKVEATTSATEDGTSSADGDEKLSDGENFADINFCDAMGNCNAVADITG